MVKEFQGEYRWLSNFWNCSVLYEGIRYNSVEHAYQAAKTTNVAARQAIAACSTPGQAKRMGRTVAMRPDWNQVKDQVMLDLLRLKFSIPELKKLLLSTGNQELQEGNKWNDTYWGVCNGRGLNKLGKLLMQVREE
jgi:hypothetical protein